MPPLGTTEINPFTDPSDFVPTLTALDEPCPEYIFACFGLKVSHGWEDMTGQAWVHKMVEIMKDDGADARLVRALEEDSVPQTVGAWQLVSMDEDDLIKWKGGRVVMIGDAAHTMAPQS